MKEITCGDDCGACKPFKDEWLLVVPVNDTPRPSIDRMHRPTFATQLPVNFCPKCGRPLGFDEQGNPTVGASYAELKAALEEASKPVSFNDIFGDLWGTKKDEAQP